MTEPSEALDELSMRDHNETAVGKRICQEKRETGKCDCSDDSELDHDGIVESDCIRWVDSGHCPRKDTVCFYRHSPDKKGDKVSIVCIVAVSSITIWYAIL
jgi:hypothetical protein